MDVQKRCVVTWAAHLNTCPIPSGHVVIVASQCVDGQLQTAGFVVVVYYGLIGRC